MSELDDIRARRAAANPQTWGTARANMALADIDTLLRMVDALTGERDDFAEVETLLEVTNERRARPTRRPHRRTRTVGAGVGGRCCGARRQVDAR